MSAETMANPLDKLKKIKGKSWEELRTRGEQVFSAKSEQMGLSGKLPTDSEFRRLIDKNLVGNGESTAQILFEQFYENGKSSFFPSFREKDVTIATFRKHFGEKSAHYFIEKAEKIALGKFSLLGYSNLDFGAKTDWHFEPISRKRSPLKHWKQFDELDSDETGDKKIVWELNRHQHFFTLGIAYNLTKKEVFARCFAEHLESWIEQNPPGMGINWVSSLEIAFRAISWIWAFHLFKDSPHFTPELFNKALKFLYLHGWHIEKYLSTYYSPNTHLTGEALGLYYLGTQLSFFNRAAHWRKLGEDILLGELDRQIFDDGVYFEQSTWYQRYTADFYTHFIILKTLCEDETDEETSEKFELKLQSLLDFLMYITRPDGSTPIIGDDDGGKMLPQSNCKPDDFRGSLAVGATIFERGDYKFVAGSVSEEVVWLLGLEGVQSFETLHEHLPNKNSVRFENGGYFIMRDGWTETDNYLLIDCGEVGSLSGGHGHADTLAIDLAVQGKTLLVDSGTYSYHESDEIRDYFRSTAAHNALTFDGKSSSESGGKFSWEIRAQAQTNSWIAQDRFNFFEGSHDGFEKSGAKYKRSILFLKNDYWIMRDYVETAGMHDYALNFHFDNKVVPQIENTANGKSCVGETAAEKEAGWQIFTFGDNGNWHKKDNWVSNNYGKKMNAPFLRFASKGLGTQEFFTFILPSEKGFAKPEIFETNVVGGRAFVIKYRDYTDLFLFTDADGQVVRTEFFDTNFQFFWARLSKRETIPEEFVMIGGTEFKLGETEIINHPTSLEFATARRLGNKINVKTSENIFSV
jgi:Heparinase II/III-like protein/Heparinase II/III N-terminus